MRRTWTYSIPSWSVATGSIRMDKVEELFEQFRARTNSSAASKLDVLLDLDRLSDPRLVSFLLQALASSTQPAGVRVDIVIRLRDGRRASERRAAVEQARIELLPAG